MERMAAGKRLDQAEAQWNRRMDRLTALHEEQERMSSDILDGSFYFTQEIAQ
jgi:hypothetical protein